jgi:hypothetical protein
MKSGAIDWLVLTIALVVFLYSFFFIPKAPVYWDNTSIHPPPRDAIKLDNGSYIVGWELPGSLIMSPIVFIIYMAIIIYAETHNGELPRIRDMHLISKAKEKITEKIKEGQDQHKEWRERKK